MKSVKEKWNEFRRYEQAKDTREVRPTPTVQDIVWQQDKQWLRNLLYSASGKRLYSPPPLAANPEYYFRKRGGGADKLVIQR